MLSDKILLFTIRSPREGGEKVDYCSKSIEEINEFVIDKALADMVDIELFATNDNCSKSDVDLIALAKERNVKIIMSNHDFEKTPHKEEIVSRLIKMQQLGADVAKIAVMPNDEEDLPTEEEKLVIQLANVEKAVANKDAKEAFLSTLNDLNVCSQKGLVEMR